MNVGKFVSNHKLLCGLTLGLAIVGYMGYKAVKWIAVKLGLVKKTDTVVQQMLSPQETSTPPLPDLKDRKIEVEKATTNKEEAPVVEKPNPIEEYLKIVQSPKSVEKYLDEEYKGDTSTARKYRARLEYIEKHYDKHQVYSVRGDGNCFCNAAVAGLLSIPNNRKKIAAILREKVKTDKNYIKPDPNSTADHLTKFQKDDDFNIVLDGLLTRTDLTTQNLLEDFNFTAAFSRVIRYILSTTSKDLCSSTNGEETDMYSIWVLNDIFNTQAKMIVLAGLTAVDPELPNIAHVACGKSLNVDEGASNVTLNTNVNSESNKPEFLIIRKSAHFITLT
jgi:hypothetical protein